MQSQAEAQIRDEGKRMRRIDGERRQQREDIGHEPVMQPVALAFGHLVGAEHGDPGRAQLAAQTAIAFLLGMHHRADLFLHGSQLLRRDQPVFARRLDTGADLAAQSRDAHHVEFIEVIGRDRQEAQPLEQRMLHVVGLFEHPLVEREPRQFAVDEALFRSGFDLRQAGGGATRHDFLSFRRSRTPRPGAGRSLNGSGLISHCHDDGLCSWRCCCRKAV